ncbi:hypothetical protein [Aestuariispira ectoiniformans]|uniref:hypothetical protein n=1 Tax=Aestuariispira ectoiniformans TaxID=2775080 RepID=UPI00223AC36D|nr:hypothetical protein [Aestuariispira ectoiniformans]
MNSSDVNATMDAGLEEFARAQAKVNQCLEAYRRECQRLIEEISAGSRSYAEKRFDMLFEITGRLSKAWFVLDIDIGADLKTVVREFERLHEPHTRDYWYKQFRLGDRWPA